MTRVLLTAFGLAAILALPTAAMAEPESFTEASARWTADGKVELTLVYQGGACEEPQEALVSASESDMTVDSVTIPTVSTAEVCTLQLVPVHFTGVIAVEPYTTRLAVLILDFDGQPKAAGSVQITSDAGE